MKGSVALSHKTSKKSVHQKSPSQAERLSEGTGHWVILGYRSKDFTSGMSLLIDIIFEMRFITSE